MHFTTPNIGRADGAVVTQYRKGKQNVFEVLRKSVTAFKNVGRARIEDREVGEFSDVETSNVRIEMQALRIAARRHLKKVNGRWLVAREHLNLVGLSERRQHRVTGATADIGCDRK